VETEPGGLSVWLPEVAVGEIRAAGIRASAESGGTRLRIERPGAELRSVTLDAESVRILISRAAPTAMRSSSGYRIGVGDVVTVAVYKNADLSGDFPVAHDGTINLPLVGPVAASGVSDTDLAARIARILDRDFLIDPQVSVSIKTYQSQWVYVTGVVTRAVRIPLSPGMTMKDALSEAGVALSPGQVAVLTRVAGSGESLTLDAEALEARDCPAPRDGDVLTVSEPAYVFVQGEVRRPGRLPLTSNLTLLQAIAMSEGLTDWANKKEVVILRTLGRETVEETINLKKVEDRRVQDPPLKAGDQILVRRRVL
jgi:polysaccharide export outer membrane protein